ncbi:carbohydrate ABC transporter permease [Paenibacillus chitinolyticus]|uniref:carbohydrate ABC transporter permease n=1 Tax=Paenibacillus chitinolyticus TaxID=79263 RepID=UPI0026E4B61F|nr:carbohydrate ABC transporter permease [Paenibacillus chitinolyticus]GKS09587.1 sugar ABC transporter permease [Paenibacillus chitinolyticus]
MEAQNRYSGRVFIAEIVTFVIALLFLVPFYFLLVNSVKSFGDLLSNAASWPESFHFENYKRAWSITKFPVVFWNSLIVTVISNIGIALISAMAAYRLVRYKSRLNQVLFGMFVAAMVIPFQSIMIPLVKVLSGVGLMDSLWGLIICYLGFGAPMAIFLFHGFVKSIPLEIEESAVVDGTSPYGVFWRIVLPLLKPMFVTVIILNALWTWNDYLLPSLVLQNQSLRTIPLATFSFFGQYMKQWDLALPALVLGITPIIIFFLAMQRYIIEGITAGSVKG